MGAGIAGRWSVICGGVFCRGVEARPGAGVSCWSCEDVGDGDGDGRGPVGTGDVCAKATVHLL